MIHPKNRLHADLKTISPLIGRGPNCSTLRSGLPHLVAIILLLFCGGALIVPHGAAHAQEAGQRYVQAGIGIIPGIGLQGGYMRPSSFYTVEGTLYVDGSPRFAGGQGSIQVSGGLGGAIRILGIIRAIGSPGYQNRDFDIGLRFGPSLFFTVGESSRDENPFSLFLEPFLRTTSSLGRDHIFFAELGIQRPILRAGIWFEL